MFEALVEGRHSAEHLGWMPRQEGVRVITRNEGRCFDIVTSPCWAYLLPELSAFSLVNSEAALEGFGRLALDGNSVQLDAVTHHGDPMQFIMIGTPPVESERHAEPPFTEDVDLAATSGSLAAWMEAKVYPHWSALSSLARPTGTELVSRGSTSSDLGGWIGDWLTESILSRSSANASTARVSPPAAPPSVPELNVALSNDPVELQPASLPADASVAEIASRIADLTELGDARLADLFNVERETFCRWRTGVLGNPRASSRRRLSLLVSLVDALAERHVRIKDWLLNQTASDGLTPYELLGQGRIDEVAYLVSASGHPPVERDDAITSRRAHEPLEFGDDDVWEPQDPDDEYPE